MIEGRELWAEAGRARPPWPPATAGAIPTVPWREARLPGPGSSPRAGRRPLLLIHENAKRARNQFTKPQDRGPRVPVTDPSAPLRGEARSPPPPPPAEVGNERLTAPKASARRRLLPPRTGRGRGAPGRVGRGGSCPPPALAPSSAASPPPPPGKGLWAADGRVAPLLPERQKAAEASRLLRKAGRRRPPTRALPSAHLKKGQFADFAYF